MLTDAGGQEQEAQQQLTCQRIASLIIHSTARVVHFDCDMLPSGGDLMFEWVLEAKVGWCWKLCSERANVDGC
jgi:hypothetical protein